MPCNIGSHNRVGEELLCSLRFLILFGRCVTIKFSKTATGSSKRCEALIKHK
jgi:hypothetical protein